MVEIIIWDPVERFLLAVAFTILFIGGLLYLKKGIEKEESKERLLMIGFTSLCFGLAVSVLLVYLRELLVPGTYNNLQNAFYGEYNMTDPAYLIIFKLSWISFFSGFTLFILSYEIIMKRTRNILTYILITLIVLFIILPYDVNFLYFNYSLGGVIILLILSRIAKWSQMDFKAISSYIILSIVFGGYSYLFTMRDIRELEVFPIWFSPLLLCIGGILMIIPMLTKPKDFSKTLIYWLVISLVTISFQIILLFYAVSSGFQILPLITTFNLTLLGFFIQYLNFKTVLSRTSKEKLSEKDLLTIFSKPERITEEEISISKEKKTCLVCKGRVGGNNFLCTECGAFYCEKCIKALTNLENVCWVCDTPFDESKPVKLQKEREKEEDLMVEKVVQEENIQKNEVKTHKKM